MLAEREFGDGNAMEFQRKAAAYSLVIGALVKGIHSFSNCFRMSRD